MLNPGPERALRLTRRFAATPERVFDAWLDPAQVRLWLIARPGDEAHTAQVEAREGGAWSITTRRSGTDYTANGVYLEITRPTRLVFTFLMRQVPVTLKAAVGLPVVVTVNVPGEPTVKTVLLTLVMLGGLVGGSTLMVYCCDPVTPRLSLADSVKV